MKVFGDTYCGDYPIPELHLIHACVALTSLSVVILEFKANLLPHVFWFIHLNIVQRVNVRCGTRDLWNYNHMVHDKIVNKMHDDLCL
jgi:hypothetical protein